MQALIEIRDTCATFGARGWLVSAGAALVAAAFIGIPTVIVANPWFVRMTPVRLQDYAIWAVTALLVGLVVGTYTLTAGEPSGKRHAVTASALSYLAVGCPICNKVVVLLLGTTGALTLFAPLQLYLGLTSIALLFWAVRLRARRIVGTCAIPQASA